VNSGSEGGKTGSNASSNSSNDEARPTRGVKSEPGYSAMDTDSQDSSAKKRTRGRPKKEDTSELKEVHHVTILIFSIGLKKYLLGGTQFQNYLVTTFPLGLMFKQAYCVIGIRSSRFKIMRDSATWGFQCCLRLYLLFNMLVIQNIMSNVKIKIS